ncbi:MAG TPA: hypothetical protein VFM35_06315 [Candidatus Binatia bacterium]|nr:hypothetical protein [Candidatus Binatia bacterium]
MEHINLGAVIEQAISKFSQNRIGHKPIVFVMISAATSDVSWHDRSLTEFVRIFLYESLLTNDPDASIEVNLRRRGRLKDLDKFVGVRPSYWLQLRISSRGLRMSERLVEDLFADVGYRCEEWVGLEDSVARLGIFAAIGKPELKMVFCLELTRNLLRCDLLIPISENLLVPCLAAGEAKHDTLRP